MGVGKEEFHIASFNLSLQSTKQSKQRHFQNIPGAAVALALPLSPPGVTEPAGPTDSRPKMLAYDGYHGSLCHGVEALLEDVGIG